MSAFEGNSCGIYYMIFLFEHEVSLDVISKLKTIVTVNCIMLSQGRRNVF